jgi:broad specificity phosphatase PhoE
MLTILYAPHMTSVDNEAQRASGYADVPLAASGREQARELGRHYAAMPLAAVFSSDLQRATETARLAFAHRALPHLSDARLRECDYGELTRGPVARVEAAFPGYLSEPFPRGESLLMVVRRVGNFLGEILPVYDGQTVALIGHRATKYGLEYWCGTQSLAEIVGTPWEWREVPIWRYQLHAHQLARRAVTPAHPHATPSAAPGQDAAGDDGWTEQSVPGS